MTSIEQKHQSAVSNYIAGKVRELAFHLRAIVDACDFSYAAHLRGDPCPSDAGIVHGFSGFTNAMQSLKDGLKQIGGEPLSWSDIAELRHGDFFGKARNAVTHDGNPIINAWVDGHYFVATNIDRLDAHGQAIAIERPREDVRTMCLAFALDFSAALGDRLEPLGGRFQIGGSPFDDEELQEIVSASEIIPEPIKQMVASRREEIRAAIVNAEPIDPVEKALRELANLVTYCECALGAG